MKIRYKSRFVSPHMNRSPVEKLNGLMGKPLLSVSVAADGPSACPSGPWHFQHSSFWYSSRPCRILSMVIGVSGGIFKEAPGFSLAQRGDQVLMNATKSARCWGLSGRQAGIAVVTNPRVTAL